MRTVPLTLLLLLLHRERYYYNIRWAVRNITVKEGKNEKKSQANNSIRWF